MLVAFIVRKTTFFLSLNASSGALIIFLLISAARMFWLCYIYPNHLSPLRHLPRPPDKPTLFMGHFFRMLEAGPGNVLRSWANSVPNDGIIRYLDFFNLERVVVVSPAALAEVLVHKCYDFEKPPQLRKGISRILGMGLFLAEGDVHKVSRLDCLFLLVRLITDAEGVYRSRGSI